MASNIIKLPNCKKPNKANVITLKADKVKNRLRTIAFLENYIKELKEAKHDPEDCVIINRWEEGDMHHHSMCTNDLRFDANVAMLEFCKHRLFD
jgi:hypothetical protein